MLFREENKIAAVLPATVLTGRGNGREKSKQAMNLIVIGCTIKKKESMGNQIPPKHFLEEVEVRHTGPHVCRAWGPVFHGMQIIIHHHNG